MMVLSMMRSLIGVMPAALLAIPLFAYSIFDLGLPLIALLGGADHVRLGRRPDDLRGADPLRPGGGELRLGRRSSCWRRSAASTTRSTRCRPGCGSSAWALPSTHVFEGMRAVMIDNVFRWDLMASAFALNVVYLAAGLGLFLLAFQSARQRGQLLHAGE